MRILFFGDIVGSLGLAGVSDLLPFLRKKYKPDFVIANGENVSRGKGLSFKDYRALVDLGLDCITLGNHWHSKDQIDHYISQADRLVRPANLIGYDKGFGSLVFDTPEGLLRVTNLLGQAFMTENVKPPFEAMNEILNEGESTKFNFVDYHAESTSEKQTFAYGFDGEISVLVGTHTHVQTNDARVLPLGTGLLTDVGMCGGFDTIIGADPEMAINRFLLLDPEARLSFPEEGRVLINAALIDLDSMDGLCKRICPLYYVDGKERTYGQN